MSKIETTSVETPFYISMPLKNIMLSTFICEKCKITIGKQDMEIDLVVMVMYDFEMDCYRKVIKFISPDQSSFEFFEGQINPSITLILVMEAHALLNEGCQGYLVVVKDYTREEAKLDGIRVVREFQDIFPEELLWLPPEREIHFEIELMPGTEPISKAPYRMALIELKELKVQLQELLDKVFIRPSESPRGTLFLFEKKEGWVDAFVH